MKICFHFSKVHYRQNDFTWLKNFYLVEAFNSFLSDLATPKNLLWWWNFGPTLGIFIIIQVFSGLISALFYCDYVNYAFISVEYLIDEINNGYILRFVHSRGARILSSLIFIHTGRRMRYKSLIMLEVWVIGALIFLILIMVPFSGYVLPWGQTSFWAATVITNLPYVIPYFGRELLEIVWGGFRVGGPTLSRFFTLHYITPFTTLPMSITHLIFSHLCGSRNPIGIPTATEKTELYWYFFLKDLHFIFLVVAVFEVVLFLFPHFFMDSENFLVADFTKTPEHIKPEWYFLFAYCILRSVPNKVGGAIGLLIRTLVLFFTPLLISANMKFADSVGALSKIRSPIRFTTLTRSGGCLVEWPLRRLGISVRVCHFWITI